VANKASDDQKSTIEGRAKSTGAVGGRSGVNGLGVDAKEFLKFYI
jgi:hypothetical protein